MLSEIGIKEDAGFVHNLNTQLNEERPLFDEECQRAVEKLENR